LGKKNAGKVCSGSRVHAKEGTHGQGGSCRTKKWGGGGTFAIKAMREENEQKGDGDHSKPSARGGGSVIIETALSNQEGALERILKHGRFTKHRIRGGGPGGGRSNTGATSSALGPRTPGGGLKNGLVQGGTELN